ncbi:MAG: lipoyl synthase [Leptolyngbya sp. PLA3]|nr:MAG: lipoyl synthase [Cyanobacteria bacterium CYA]MCE7969510.1 lipoyl synthase [Leptolyngbya sp. PL-A3]
MTSDGPPIQPTSGAISRTLARHPRPLGGQPIRGAKPTISLTDQILNNQSIQTLALKKKPAWLKARVPGGEGFLSTKSIIDRNRLHTVCQEASCPNMGECWARGVATIMILGDTCTRACGFCNVKTGKPPVTDLDEPRRVADALRGTGLKHIVITSVDRDDLSDGGAGLWAETIVRVRDACPDLSIEVLIGDFRGDEASLQMVIDAQPNIIAHNLETVRRCHPAVRPSARYERSIELLRRVKAQGRIAKTGLMVGIGERREEVLECLRDIIEKTTVARVAEPGLHACGQNGVGIPPNARLAEEARGVAPEPVGPAPDATRDACDIITIGQYLQPTLNHLPIDRWVHPDEFAEYERAGKEAGFKVVFSGPLVRSSYLADKQAEGLKLGF